MISEQTATTARYCPGFSSLRELVTVSRNCPDSVRINTTIKTTSVGDASVCDGSGRGWLACDIDGLAGWPVAGDGGRGQPASSRH